MSSLIQEIVDMSVGKLSGRLSDIDRRLACLEGYCATQARVDALWPAATIEVSAFDKFETEIIPTDMFGHKNEMLIVTFPCGQRMRFNKDMDEAWVGLAHWGHTRSRYKPMLEKYDIPFVEIEFDCW